MNVTLDNLEQRLKGIDGGAQRLRPAEAADPEGVAVPAEDRALGNVLRLRRHLEKSIVADTP